MAATILVADHEPGICEMLALELSRRGFEVTGVRDSAAAAAAMRATEFDVLLSNVRMPGTLEASRLHAPDTEVIITAGPTDLSRALAAVRDGAFDYVSTPFDLGDLVQAVGRAIEHRQLRASTALYEASRCILDAKEPQRLPATIVEVAMKVMNADDVSLMLLGSGDRLYVAYSHGLPANVMYDVRQEVGERVAGWVARTREPALITDGLEADDRFRDIPSYHRVRSSIVYPITAGDRLVGVLNINRVEQERPFRKLDLDKAAVLASQILLALENARLVRSIATTQQLTTIGQVSSSVVHEINNPVSYVLASETHLRERLADLRKVCEMIERGAVIDDVRRTLDDAGGMQLMDDLSQATDDIREGATRVRDIMRDLRSLARNRASRPVVFELSSAIRSSMRVVAAELRHKATVVTDLTDGAMVSGSPGRLSQVFVNLLVNAGEALGPTGPHLIEIVSRREGDNAVIRVRDDGPGIAPQHLPRVFESFFTTKAHGASGLGLPIARDIVRGLGGEIRVESELGVGTTVTLTVPCIPDALPLPPPPPAPTPEVTPFKILFVDDEKTILRGYNRRFSKGHAVTVAESGAEAIRILEERQGEFDLVVCDLSMPDTNGMDVYGWVREHIPALAERFVFATGGATQRDLEQFLRTVPNEVLEKPFELGVIQELIDRRRSR